MTRPAKLDRLRRENPCAKAWESLTPIDDADRSRHCGTCDLVVHNIARHTTEEARSLLDEAADGRRCLLVTRTPSGDLVTADGPRPRSAKTRRHVLRHAAAWLVALFGVGCPQPETVEQPDAGEPAEPATNNDDADGDCREDQLGAINHELLRSLGGYAF